MADRSDLRLFGGSMFSKVGMRAQSEPCKCNGGIVRPQSSMVDGVGGIQGGNWSFRETPQALEVPVPVPTIKKVNMWPESMGDGTDAITNAGVVTKTVQRVYGVPRSGQSGVLLKPQAITTIPRYPPGGTGLVTGSVPIDKRTLLYHYGYV